MTAPPNLLNDGPVDPVAPDTPDAWRSGESGVFVYAWRDACWTPMALGAVPLPGFSWWPLAGDEQGAWDAYWMRVDASAQSPRHVHPATELLHIHQGQLADADGRVYGPGDVAVFSAGSEHFTRSPAGCVALVVTARQAAVTDRGSG